MNPKEKMLVILLVPMVGCGDPSQSRPADQRDMLSDQQNADMGAPRRYTIAELNPARSCNNEIVDFDTSDFLPTPSSKPLYDLNELSRQADGMSRNTSTYGHAFWPGTLSDEFRYLTVEGPTQVNLGYVLPDFGEAIVRIMVLRDLKPIRFRARRRLQDGGEFFFDQKNPAVWTQEYRYGSVVVEIEPPDSPGVRSVTLVMEADFGTRDLTRLSNSRLAWRFLEFHDSDGDATIRPCLEPPAPIELPEQTDSRNFVVGPTLRHAGFPISEVDQSVAPITVKAGDVIEVEVLRRGLATSPDWYHSVIVDHDGDFAFTWQEGLTTNVDPTEFFGFSHNRSVRMQFWKPGEHRLQVFSLNNVLEPRPKFYTSNTLVVNVEE